MEDNKLDGNDVVIDLGDYNANSTYTLGSGGNTFSIDSITLPSSVYTTGSSGNGYTITSTGTGYSYDWNNSIYTSPSPTVRIDTDGVDIKEGGDIKIAGKSLSEAIEKIEERLGILNPNPELEDRWDQLKELRKQYMELEKDLLEKEKLMKILKEK